MSLSIVVHQVHLYKWWLSSKSNDLGTYLLLAKSIFSRSNKTCLLSLPTLDFYFPPFSLFLCFLPIFNISEIFCFFNKILALLHFFSQNYSSDEFLFVSPKNPRERFRQKVVNGYMSTFSVQKNIC